MKDAARLLVLVHSVIGMFICEVEKMCVGDALGLTL